MAAGWADLTVALDELRDWLSDALGDGIWVYTDGPPTEPPGPYVVLQEIGQPRSGPPLAGMVESDWTVQATSVGWDASKKRSFAKQTRYLGAKVCGVVAGTDADGTPTVDSPTLTGLLVLRRDSEGDGRLDKAGDVWQRPETFRIRVAAA